MNNIYIHPAALVESEAIGEGTRIWAFTHVLPGTSIGAYCNIGEHCFIETGAVIGNCVTIKNGNQLWDGIRVADGVFIGPSVRLTNDLWPRSPRLSQARSRYCDRKWMTPTLIEQGASIGAGAVIVAGNTIGAFAMVAAGAVVTHAVPPHALVVGAPARPVGWVCECGCRLTFANSVTTCENCGFQIERKLLESKARLARTAGFVA